MNMPEAGIAVALRAEMHIAYVTETYPPELNGVALTVARTVRGLRARGHAVQLIRPRQTTEADRDTDDEWRVPGTPIPMYPALRVGLPVVGRLSERWTRLRPNLVHVATEGPLGWAAVRAARLLGVPVTSDFRTNFDEYSAHYGFGWMSGLVRAYLRYFHNGTDRTLVPTAATRHALEQKGYRRLEVLGRGVDCRQFSPARRSDTLRAEWGASAFGAFEAARARVPGARLVVVGDGPLRARLQAQSPGALFVGQKSGVDLAEHYASADIFVFPSTTETFGNVTLEALASGLAVVAFRSGAAAVHIEDCLSGVLVDSGDDQGFVAGVCAVAQQVSCLGPMRQAARDAALQASWDVVLGRFESFLADTADALETPLAGSCPA
jgi:glycosyltransferase involved in cell wall biosynthesis